VENCHFRQLQAFLQPPSPQLPYEHISNTFGQRYHYVSGIARPSRQRKSTLLSRLPTYHFRLAHPLSQYPSHLPLVASRLPFLSYAMFGGDDRQPQVSFIKQTAPEKDLSSEDEDM
jgi:hypothetical protein